MYNHRPFQRTTSLDEKYFEEVERISTRGYETDWLLRLGYFGSIPIVGVPVYLIIKYGFECFNGETYSCIVLSLLPALILAHCVGFFLDYARAKNYEHVWNVFKRLTLPYISHIHLTEEPIPGTYEEREAWWDVVRLEQYAQDMGVARRYNHLLKPDDYHDPVPSPILCTIRFLFSIPLMLLGAFFGGALMGGPTRGKERSTLTYAEKNKAQEFLNLTKRRK